MKGTIDTITKRIYVALDVSKDTLEVEIETEVTGVQSTQTVPNNYRGFQQVWRMIRSSKAEGTVHVCMEATGSYWDAVALFFYNKGCIVHVVNPARIKAQRKTEQKRSKTDRIDTGCIRRFLRANVELLRVWHPMRASVAELQHLVRLRANKVARRASLKTLLKSKTLKGVALNEVKDEMQQLDASIERLDNEIARVIEQDEELAVQAANADSVIGVGQVVASVLLAECRGFAEISDPRQATAFAGFDVVEESSGTIKKPPRISRQGSALLRKTFVTAAASALRPHGTFREFYQRLRARGMKKKPALVATARKLLEVTVAVVLKGEVFDPNRNCKNQQGSVTRKSATKLTKTRKVAA